ncbi:MAG TPA: TonB-dependent receptor [candidate division WOR-3 bacterium]|uniref:TonB-dependent receptor n=1 Tax=candidate division WOR-3 bacterium TaxID=2052148 RepID=A0A7V0XFU5_UNCW3|nr:TonB-dependent receptor [candidate division WOR-3 bacterium]
MTAYLFLILLPAIAPAQVSGTVVDGLSGLPLPAANVVLLGTRTGVAADLEGGFLIRGLNPGRYRLVASHVSFLPETLEVALAEGGGARLSFRLAPAPLALPEVKVSAGRVGRGEVVTKREISAEDLRDRAGGFIQDPVRSLSFLPGVSHTARGEWSGQYVVRGGDPDESRIWFDNVELLWPYHLLGFSSMINADVVAGMEFYPTAFPARYGGALSSVTVIRPRDTGPAEGTFAYDPMNLKASYAGRLDEVEVAASLRRTFYHVQFGPTGSGRDNQPSYTDYLVRLGLPLGREHRARLMLIGGSDRILTDLRGTATDITEQGRTAAVMLESDFGRFRSEVTGWYGDHEFGLEPTRWQGRGGTAEREVGLRLAAATGFGGVDVSGGVQAGRATFAGNLLERDGFGRNDLIAAGWLDARLGLGPRAALDCGVRFEEVRWVRDRALDPRAVASYRLGPGAEVRAGWRRVHQHPYSFLRRSVAGIVFDNEYALYETFRAGELLAKSADHYSVAGEFELGGLARFDIEAYRKDYSNLPSWREDSPGGRFDYGSAGYGRADGFEAVLAARPVDGYSGQVTYGLAWSRKQQGADTMAYWDEYDRRHAVNLTAMKEWPGDWRLTATFNLHTGSPYTPLIHYRERREVGGSDLGRGGAGHVVRGEKNSLRVPTYHRLDLKIQKELAHLPLKPFFYIEVLNVYNRENVYHLVQFETRNGDIRTGRFTGIQFIPLIGMGGRF